MSKSISLSILRDPFNRIYGISVMNYDYVDSLLKQHVFIERHIRKLVSRKSISFKRSVNIDDWKAGIHRKFVSGKTERQWRKKLAMDKVFNKNCKLVLKDPFLCISHDCTSTLDFVKKIQVVRHLAAAWCAIKNMDWDLKRKKNGSSNYQFFGNVNLTATDQDEYSEVEKFAIISEK